MKKGSSKLSVFLMFLVLPLGCGGKTSNPGTCTEGRTNCGDMCVDTQIDPNHCGQCNRECDVAGGEVCLNGSCELDCGLLTHCDGACVDLQTNPYYCGDCVTACDVPGGEVCLNGSCQADCGSLTDCGGRCVDTQSDPDYCGDCTTVCDTDGGEVCLNGSCRADCGTLTDCDGACVDLQSDPNYCGDCTTVCDTAGGEVCLSGSCELDCGSLTDCDGACVDTDTDPNNCGDCGEACVVDNGTAGCDQGDCTVASCNSGWADCDEDPDNGCEINTEEDPDNCGGCDLPCGANVLCVAGECGQSGVTCDGALCPSGEQCCWEGGGVGEYCYDPNNESCDGAEENCDGPEDCPNPGDICCHDPGNGNFAECLPMNQCGSGLIFCAEDADCYPARPYCCPMMTYFAICSDNLC